MYATTKQPTVSTKNMQTINTTTQALKKVLIISYAWPPCGGIGVLRNLKIAKYLPQFGWQPIIYTALNADYSIIDRSNQRHVSPDTVLLRQPIIEPFGVYKRLTNRPPNAPLVDLLNNHEQAPNLFHHLGVWVRSNFFIPDARSLWIRPSVRYLQQYLRQHPVDAIFTDGPPHTNTAIATHIKQRTGIPWLADFQDPWTQVDYYQQLTLSRWADRRHRQMEQAAFAAADKMTVVSPTWAHDLQAIGARNVSVVYWGYDEEDFAEPPPPLHQPQFVVSHWGLLGNDRHPDTLLRVLATLCSEHTAFAQHLQIHLAGAVDRHVKNSIEQYQLSPQTHYLGQIARQQALQQQQQSAVLLLLLNKADNAMGRIPGKLFEYLRSRRPILSLGPVGCDVQQLLEQTQSGANFAYDDADALKNWVWRQFELHQQGQLYLPPTDLTPYDIRHLTARIAGYLDDISAGNSKG